MLATLKRRWLPVCLGAYWLAIFAATHVPRLPEGVDLSRVSDKSLHYLAYGGLAFLLSAWRTSVRGWSWVTAAQILVIAALYGAIDELLQIPVNRHADVADWLSDLLGSITGMAAFWMLRTAFVRLVRQPAERA